MRRHPHVELCVEVERKANRFSCASHCIAVHSIMDGRLFSEDCHFSPLSNDRDHYTCLNRWARTVQQRRRPILISAHVCTWKNNRAGRLSGLLRVESFHLRRLFQQINEMTYWYQERPDWKCSSESKKWISRGDTAIDGWMERNFSRARVPHFFTPMIIACGSCFDGETSSALVDEILTSSGSKQAKATRTIIPLSSLLMINNTWSTSVRMAAELVRHN